MDKDSICNKCKKKDYCPIRRDNDKLRDCDQYKKDECLE